MSFGVTPTGFVTKRLPDIKAELEETLRGTFGVGINLQAEEPLGQIVGIFSEREAKLWELAESVWNSAYPDTAEGVSLDNAAALTGIVRQGQTYSRVDATFYGDSGTVIPVGTVVSVEGNSSARFVTISELITADAVDEVQKVQFGATPTVGVFSLSFLSQVTSNLPFNATATQVQTALRALPNLSDDLVVTGSIAAGFTVTFQGADGSVNQAPLTVNTNTLLTALGAPVSVTVTTITPGTRAEITGPLIAESPGAVAAPAGSLTVIETQISGLTGVENALDAELGDEIESDAQLRLRRMSSLQKAGAGTLEAIKSDILGLDGVEAALVFENDTLSVDTAGRPAKSFEVVVLGGDDDEIAETIWQDKPAGIQTFGTQSVVIQDSQGFERTIKFSRPTEVPIWVEFDLTITDAFPLSGPAQVEAAVLAYGANLNLGDDVIVLPALISALAGIPGITNVAVRIGTAPDPVGSANIPIDAFEIAIFDSSRIGVTIL